MIRRENTEQKILTHLKEGKLNKGFDLLYNHYFTDVERWVKKHSGTSQEARDVFQEVLMALYRKLLDQELVLTATLKTYLLSVAKNLWLKRLSKKRQERDKLREWAADADDHRQDDHEMVSKGGLSLIPFIWKQIGEKCKQLLLGFYFEKKDLEVLARELSLRNAHVARTQKYRCMLKAKEIASEQPTLIDQWL